MKNHPEHISHLNNLLEESDKHLQRLLILSNLNIEIHYAVDLTELTNLLSGYIQGLIRCDYASFTTINKQGVWETHSLSGEIEIDYQQFDIKNPILSDVVSTLNSKLIDEDKPRLISEYNSNLIIPIHHNRIIMGTLQFARNEKFDGEDLRLGLLLCYHLATVIHKFNQIEILLEAQEQLANYTYDLINHNEDIEAYNHTIAHDLKSPLNVISLKASMIKMTDKMLSPSTAQYIDDIRSQVDYINTIIDQLLILSTINSDNKSMSVLNMNQIVENSLRRFVEVETKEVEITIQPDLPQVVGHTQWFEEIFANLISNAIKYRGTSNNKPHVKITADIINDKAMFHVTDNGIGINTDSQQHIFKMFKRVHEIEAEGLGLGLAIVHRIVKKLDGEIGLESEVGKGTRFWFTVPIYNPDDHQNTNTN